MKRIGGLVLALIYLSSLIVPAAFADRNEKITVLNPRGIKPEIRKIPMAPRPATIDGKTIYIVDTKYPNTKPFVKEFYAGLKNKYPGTNWVLREKIGSYMQDDPDLWKEIKAKAAGAVILLGH
ncbi:MAG: hypothetical protein PVG39_22670 [Desulfobacteraceae bacterium]|jgi:hypothetical protein